jgi:hypothetical protein
MRKNADDRQVSKRKNKETMRIKKEKKEKKE